MTGYAIKLPKELKESLASDFDSNWDSDREDGVAAVDDPAAPHHQHAAENAPAREGFGSVSSESSSSSAEGRDRDESDRNGNNDRLDEKDRSAKSMGRRLKRILSTDTKLPKLSEGEDEGR